MKASESHSLLPPRWSLATIGDLVAPFENSNPACSGRDAFQYVDIEAIDNGAHRITNAKALPTSKAPSRARKVIRTGDVLISLVRPYLKNIAIVPQELDQQWASTAFCVCRPHPDIDSRFFYYMFLQNDFLNALPTYGDSPPSGHDDDLLATTISLPPADEIVRIADRIDELFTDLSAGVAALERVKRNLSRYRAAVLHAAVTGRLTEAWRKQHGPPDEPGPKLLERILAERRRRWEVRTRAKYEKAGKQPPKNWLSRYAEPAAPNTADLPQLPKGWCYGTLEQLADVTGGVAKNGKEAGDDGMRTVPYLRVANVQRGFLDLSEVKMISAREDDIATLRLVKGDVLFTEGGDRDKLGRGWIWSGEIDECIHQNHIFRARLFLADFCPHVLSYAGNSYGRIWFRRNGKQSVNLASISLGVLRQFPVPVIPLAEQEAVMETVNEKLSQIDALEVEVVRGLIRASRLRQAILKAAFEGKLVPQDPTDETASVLLDRIRDAAPPVEHKLARKPRQKSAGKVTAS